MKIRGLFKRSTERGHVASRLAILSLPFLTLTGCYTAGMIGASFYHPPTVVPARIKGPEAVYSPKSGSGSQPAFLVIVRYPAKIDPKAESIFKRSVEDKYLTAPKGSMVGRRVFNFNPNPHRHTITRSTYHAIELFA